ncbi:MAG: ComF family protein [Endomicrobium sp.]|uniref:ComF family protein n=1 Tax=Candidatus Endomicrobiellum cubanum TaxID=3242325 RepID=UPI00283918D9|nr:ComF family protein [Endomicrobium sp.]MDR2395716.1 ComF family protein [Endomicrobium sp.]
MKKIFLKVINLIYPLTCSLCGRDLSAVYKYRICNNCKESLNKIKNNVCEKCGIPLDSGGNLCYACKKDLKIYKFDKLRSVYLYKGHLRKLILKFKYSKRTFLYKDFAFEMSKLIQEYEFFKNSDFIIPVPLNILRKIKRGYNQAELLAEGVSIQSGIPMLTNILFRKKVTKPQFRLSKFERVKNIQNSFVVKNKSAIKDRTILLIDDIATTCSTISVCANVLKDSGAKNVFVLTLARD